MRSRDTATFAGSLDGDFVGSSGFNKPAEDLDDSGDIARWGDVSAGDTRSRMEIMDGGFSHELVGWP